MAALTPWTVNVFDEKSNQDDIQILAINDSRLNMNNIRILFDTELFEPMENGVRSKNKQYNVIWDSYFIIKPTPNWAWSFNNQNRVINTTSNICALLRQEYVKSFWVYCTLHTCVILAHLHRQIIDQLRNENVKLKQDLKQSKLSKSFVMSRAGLGWTYGIVLLNVINGDEMDGNQFQALNLNMKNTNNLKQAFQTKLQKAPSKFEQAISHWITLKNQGAWCSNTNAQ